MLRAEMIEEAGSHRSGSDLCARWSLPQAPDDEDNEDDVDHDVVNEQPLRSELSHQPCGGGRSNNGADGVGEEQPGGDLDRILASAKILRVAGRQRIENQ